jgi:hypothetical protein
MDTDELREFCYASIGGIMLTTIGSFGLPGMEVLSCSHISSLTDIGCCDRDRRSQKSLHMASKSKFYQTIWSRRCTKTRHGSSGRDF